MMDLSVVVVERSEARGLRALRRSKNEGVVLSYFPQAPFRGGMSWAEENLAG